MPRTYGTFRYAAKWPGRRQPVFVISATPHVRSTFKRTFPGHGQHGGTGEIVVSATEANARDLEWFTDRWPLEPVDGDSLAHMVKLATAHRNGEEELLRILGGGTPDVTFPREPALKPRDYQLLVPAMLRARGFLLLGDDLGLGKTFASSLVMTDPAALPALVVAPTHLVDQWADEELPKYYPWIRTHVLRKGTPYNVAAHRSCKGQQPHVLVSTYAKLHGWSDHLAGRIKTVIFDEGDELRTGETAMKYTAALQIARQALYRIIATATPVHNYADEMWNLIDLLCEGALGTKDEFRLSWGGKHLRDPRELGQYLRDEGIMLRRTRADVGRELPPVSQMIQPVETDHDLLKEEMDGILAMAAKVLDNDTERIEKFSLSGQLDMKIRKATGVAKAPFVAAFVRLLLQSQEKVVLVGHHHAVYDIWRRELAEYNPVFFTGAESKTQKAEAKRRFVSGDSRVFVMAVRSGSGLNGLQDVCSTQVFGEIDWSPARHKQVVGRLNRDGQTEPVTVFFMMSDGGSDPPMADIIELKRQIAEPITDPDADVVQPSPDEAMRRVKELAKRLLRQHGVNGKPAPTMPAPEPGSGELFPADALPRQAVAAAAARAETTRVLEGRARPSGSCGLCGKAMFTYPPGRQLPDSLAGDAEDCGGDCWGCVREIEESATEAANQPVPASRPANRDDLRGRLTGART